MRAIPYRAQVISPHWNTSRKAIPNHESHQLRVSFLWETWLGLALASCCLIGGRETSSRRGRRRCIRCLEGLNLRERLPCPGGETPRRYIRGNSSCSKKWRLERAILNSFAGVLERMTGVRTQPIWGVRARPLFTPETPLIRAIMVMRFSRDAILWNSKSGKSK